MLDTTSTLGEPSIAEQQKYWDLRWERSKNPNSWQVRRGEAIFSLLERIPLDHPKILDLGCATGWFTDKLSQLGQATGIDLSEHAIGIARKLFPNPTFIQGNIFEMPVPAETFDLIVSQEVIAHVEDQPAFVEWIASALKPDGYLVITAANRLVIDRADFGPDPREHIKKWIGMRGLKRLLAGRFDILKATSAIPIGQRGFLRVVNSAKLNAAMSVFVGQQRLDKLKERLGLGYTLMILAQKKA